ncbi:peptide-methionine (S)-S-oxide reductase MsrA [Sulfurospirillum sp. 1612]|uniref:peptide-methionine (S)-S-oxide reductase MsrA n=1 Tax=Sulfurospirillum sp. 1612 TaxID=3094835 RepID=UPI002F932386
MEHSQTVILGGGCFWCLEAVFEDVKGVTSVESGYAGGVGENPTYEQVSTGKTGYAEVVKVTFDEHIVTLEKLLNIFFAIHDPTSLNQQGNDIGTQYRSVIFYTDDAQKEIAQKVMQEEAPKFNKPIVTELAPAPVFYKAEAYHQDYFKKNPYQGYCVYVVKPKVEKFLQKFPTLKK